MEDLDGNLHSVVLRERGPVDLRAAARPQRLAVKVGEDVGEAIFAKVPLQGVLRLPPPVLPYPPLQLRKNLTEPVATIGLIVITNCDGKNDITNVAK